VTTGASLAERTPSSSSSSSSSLFLPLRFSPEQFPAHGEGSFHVLALLFDGGQVGDAARTTFRFDMASLPLTLASIQGTSRHRRVHNVS